MDTPQAKALWLGRFVHISYFKLATGTNPEDKGLVKVRRYVSGFARALGVQIELPGDDRANKIGEFREDMRFDFHVFGSQGLAWSRKGIHSAADRERFLRQVLQHVEEGVKRHSREATLKQLLEDIRKEYLSLAVYSPKGLFPPR